MRVHHASSMSYNPGGWNENKLKWYGIALLVAVVLRGLWMAITGK